MNKNPQPQIYFIRPVGQDSPIKVGFSIQSRHRLHELMKWSPVPLEIVAELDVTDWRSNEMHILERRFHLRYAAHKMHREWFAAHPLILSDIKAINAGTFCASCLPEWERVNLAFIRGKVAA